VTDQTQATDTPAAPRPGTTHPHLARERALKVLFAADVRGVDPRVLVDEVATHPEDLELLDELEPDQDQVEGDEELQLELKRRRRLPLDDYTRALVSGVASRRPSIDEVLGDVADRWPVPRMPVVDRNLLRLAVYELAEQDTPNAVVIDEAVALAIAFAGEKARGFVNGVLETVRQQVVAGDVTLLVEEPAPEPAVPDDPDEADETAADVDGATTDTTEPEGEEADAADEAYTLALGLLDGDEDLDDWADEDNVDHEEDDQARDEPVDDVAEQLGVLGSDDEDGDGGQDDPLW
jgi:N utilization substance protein B